MNYDEGGPRGIRVAPSSYPKLEASARAVRSLLPGAGKDTDPLPGVELFESLDDLVVTEDGLEIPLDYQVQRLPADVEGETRYDASKNRIVISLDEEVYHRLRRGDGRARFSLVHEIGHAVVHTATLLEIAHIPHAVAALRRAKREPHKVFCDSEWQADSWAAAALMPASGLAALEARVGRLSIAVVQKHFGVSLTAAKVRLRNFEKKRSALLGT